VVGGVFGGHRWLVCSSRPPKKGLASSQRTLQQGDYSSGCEWYAVVGAYWRVTDDVGGSQGGSE